MERWIHVDLKHLPPTAEALCEDLSRWAVEGATGVLLEWENLFPYPGCAAVRDDAYTPAEVKTILDRCRALGLKAVPLVQTLGHVEWCLSHPAYEPLREFPRDPRQLKACDPDSWRLVEGWLDAVMEAHGDTPFVHLGGDEAWGLRDVDRPDCSALRDGASAVYLRHMRPLIAAVVARGKRPVLWADMVLSHPESINSFPREVIFCDWFYRQTASHADRVHGWGMPQITEASYDTLPESARRTFEPYWRLDAPDFPRQFYQFPYVPFLRDHGFDVITASACLYAGNAMSATALPKARANQRGWIEACRRFGGAGALDTCWSIRGALRETSRTAQRAFLMEAREFPIASDAAVSTACWASLAGDRAGVVAAAVDDLNPPVNLLTQSLANTFDPESRQHRMLPFAKRRDKLLEAMRTVADSEAAASEMSAAIARSEKAVATLDAFCASCDETRAWTLAAREIALHGRIWLALFDRVRSGNSDTTAIRRLADETERMGSDFLSFASGRYRPADLATLREDRFEGLRHLLDK